MTYSEFEKNAARKINQYASGIDGEALWAAIEPEVPVAKNRRRGFFWLLSLGAIALIAASIWWGSDLSNHNPRGQELSVASILSEQSDDSAKQAKPSTITQEKEISDEPATVKGSSESQNTNITSSNTKTPNKQRNSKKSTNLKASSTKTAVAKPGNNTSGLNSTPLTGSEKGLSGIEMSTETPASESVELFENSMVDDASQESKPEIQDPALLDLSGVSEKETIESVVNEKENEGNDKSELIEEEATPAPPSRGLGLNFGFGIYSGISRSTAALDLREGTNPEYLQSRLNSEKQLETLHLGAEVIGLMKNGVYFRTGVQYSRIARKFAVDAELISYDTVPDGIQAIYVNSTTNDTIIVYGEVVKQTTTTYDKTTYNNFHLLDIPLMAGYSFSNDEWSIGIEAGAVFNVSNQSKGEVYDLSGEFYDLKTDRNGWYKTNVGVGLQAGLTAAYKVGNNFQIHLSPTFRLGSVFSTDKNPLKQKHASLGVNAGVRYFLD